MLKRNCVLRVSKRRRCARYGRISRLTAAPHRSGRDLAAERAEIAGHGAENDVTTPSNIRVKITAAPGRKTPNLAAAAPDSAAHPKSKRKWPATRSPRA